MKNKRDRGTHDGRLEYSARSDYRERDNWTVSKSQNAT